MFDYEKYNEYEKTISKVEEKVIKDHWKEVVDGNDSFEDRSSSEMQGAFWIFRHGWILSQMFLK